MSNKTNKDKIRNAYILFYERESHFIEDTLIHKQIHENSYSSDVQPIID